MSIKLDAPDAGECRNCGAHVTDRFRRVFGDNDDIVYACTQCETQVAVLNGHAAGKVSR